jgi:hypothetical protein
MGVIYCMAHGKKGGIPQISSGFFLYSLHACVSRGCIVGADKQFVFPWLALSWTVVWVLEGRVKSPGQR